MHDLLRLYARQLSDDHAEADEREQATDRLLGYYLDSASAADDSYAGAARAASARGVHRPR